MYCQGLLGVGHLMRFVNIAEAIDGEVVIVYGGEPVAGLNISAHIQIIQQPPVRSDWTFSMISSTQDPSISLEQIQDQRQKVLLNVIDRFQPDAFVIDSFPFSRRKFAPEIISAVEKIKKKNKSCRIITSLRDMNYGRPAQDNFNDRVVKKLKKYVDLVLVHSDHKIEDRKHPLYFGDKLPVPHLYTGYVVNRNLSEPRPARVKKNIPSVVVQIGGGRVGAVLFKLVHDAIPFLKNEINVNAFMGAFKPDSNGFKPTHKNFHFHAFGQDYFKELKNADLLISQCGYNSMTDALASQIKWITLPFVTTGEQTIRAKWLHDHGVISAVFPEHSDAAQVAKIIDDHLSSSHDESKKNPYELLNMDLNGAKNAADIICGKTESGL